MSLREDVTSSAYNRLIPRYTASSNGDEIVDIALEVGYLEISPPSMMIYRIDASRSLLAPSRDSWSLDCHLMSSGTDKWDKIAQIYSTVEPSCLRTASSH
jgi:hypothetical protein